MTVLFFLVLARIESGDDDITVAEAEVDDLTLCCHCGEQMTLDRHPVWLPCSDSFCRACVIGRDSCPNCEEAFDLSSEGVKKYECDFLSRLMGPSSVPDVEVSLCERKVHKQNIPRAQHRCEECAKNFCEECRNTHGEFLADHNVVQLEQNNPQCSWQQDGIASCTCSQCKFKHIADDLKNLEEEIWKNLDNQEESIAGEIRVESEEEKKRISELVHKKIEKIKQDGKMLHCEVDSWRERKIGLLEKQLENCKTNSPVLRKITRWSKFVEQLMIKDTVGEQLEFKEYLGPLKDALDRLQVADLPKLSCRRTLNFEQSKDVPTLGSLEEVDRIAASASSDTGMCICFSHIFLRH